MEIVPCESETRCFPCLSYSYCMFVILVGGKGICMEKADSTAYNVKTMLYSSRDCDPGNGHYVQRYDTGLGKSGWITFDIVQRWDMPISQEQRRENRLNENIVVETPPDIQMKSKIVSTKLTVYNIKLDEAKYMFTVTGWLYLEWLDTDLATVAWLEDTGIKNPISDNRIYYGKDDIWRPEINLYNTERFTPVDTGSWSLRADDVGKVTWNFPVQLISKCHPATTRQPYNSLNCSFALYVSSRPRKNDYDLKDKMVVENFNKSSKWILSSADVQRAEDRYRVNPFVAIQYMFSFERNLPSVSWNTKWIIYATTVANLYLLQDSSENCIVVALGAFVHLSLSMIYFISSGSFSDDQTSPIALLCLWNYTFLILIFFTALIIKYCSLNTRLPHCIQFLLAWLGVFKSLSTGVYITVCVLLIMGER